MIFKMATDLTGQDIQQDISDYNFVVNINFTLSFSIFTSVSLSAFAKFRKKAL